jgi:hypothetical protein
MKKLKFVPLSQEHRVLAENYAELMGYECIIDNDNRKAIIIDETGKVGLLVVDDKRLYYQWKGKRELIEVSLLEEDLLRAKSLTKRLSHLGTGMNKILTKIFEVDRIKDFKERANNAS